MKTKQIIVVRKDLKMRKGKISAQVAHASMKVILDHMSKTYMGDISTTFTLTVYNHTSLHDWLLGQFTKVVVGCNSIEELLNLKHEAEKRNIWNTLIKDSGKTEFHGIPTYTCLAIGPDLSWKIDDITKHLKLL
jgi:PTH2 family peptidyl-tRNA hydrolase